ncbi:MAG: hypothetical protein DWH99_11770 [Planctomycetota bacterium]|nr:MAG: hypothetical protein DWH99_11770 [Planctomycetota bacterium]
MADSLAESLPVDPLDSIQASIRSSQSCPGDHFQVEALVNSLESEPSARHSVRHTGPMAPRAIHPKRIHPKTRGLSDCPTRWIFKTGSVSSKVGVVRWTHPRGLRQSPTDQYTGPDRENRVFVQ